MTAWIRVSLVGTIFFLGGCDMFHREKVKLNCKGPVKIYDTPDCAPNAIKEVPAGTVLSVTKQGYGKDCKYYRVELPDGSVGYAYHGDKFEVIGGRAP